MSPQASALRPRTKFFLRAGNVTMDRDACRVDIAGSAVAFTYQEYRLLAIFMRRPNLVLPRKMICEMLWGESGPKEAKRLAVVISHLRDKLFRSRPYAIECVRSRGYGLVEQPSDTRVSNRRDDLMTASSSCMEGSIG